ncbi:hypothetical protein [Mycolicibacterium moriokaense]|nr:hypothetical protein [Mycolicibacterium moriokaense]MCV7041353.1 hypothetical protein [Mycolicibacterium moriokaense]
MKIYERLQNDVELFEPRDGQLARTTTELFERVMQLGYRPAGVHTPLIPP